jgi:hypothetical protein
MYSVSVKRDHHLKFDKSEERNVLTSAKKNTQRKKS